jgi:DNA-binding transcriptional LysR family regulator
LCKGGICIEVRLEDSIVGDGHHVTIVKTRRMNEVFEVDSVLTTRTLASPGRGICYPPTCMPLEKPSLAKIRVRVFEVMTFDPEMCSLSFLDGCVSQSKKEI